MGSGDGDVQMDAERRATKPIKGWNQAKSLLRFGSGPTPGEGGTTGGNPPLKKERTSESSNMATSRVSLAAAIALVLIPASFSFYLPGVAPTDYTKGTELKAKV